jgi:hypothetical protein
MKNFQFVINLVYKVFKNPYIFLTFSFVSGRESGVLSNSKNWKKITPPSQYSPFIAQGDIGFFQYHRKSYGQFFCAVNTYSKKIFAIPIKNLKAETLMLAIKSMLKVI